jgi:hypothetical protein
MRLVINSTFKRKPGAAYSSFAGPKQRMARTAMKKRAARKPTIAEGSKYLAACRGESCFLRVPGVCIGSSTVVPAHSNQSRHGKGMGIKADHKYTVPACQACHAYIDQGPAPRQKKFNLWDYAYELWLPVRERKMGLAEVECAS